MPDRSLQVSAGGRATRLGGVTKGFLEVGGRRIVDRILGSLAPLVDEVVFLTNDPTLEVPASDARLILDESPHAGVLPALANGLAAANANLVLAVAFDMPFVSAAAFRELLDLQAREDADVVIPRTEGYLEPMHAVYRRQAVLEAVQRALGAGEQRMNSYFKFVRVREVSPEELGESADDPSPFFNVNTPEDLAEANRLAARIQA